MPATLERTVAFDRDLARRADRKLRRYGQTFDAAVNAALASFVSRRGNPFAHVADNEEKEVPGARLLASFREAELMEKGILPKQNFNSVEELFAECRS